MSNALMVGSVEDFWKAIDGIGNELKDFSVTVEDKRGSILAALLDFQNHVNALSRKPAGKSGKGVNKVQEAMNRSQEKIGQEISRWKEEQDKNVKGVKFMSKNQKYLVAMVFGEVKTGKSTLGNYFAGKYLKDAPFDNLYKHKAPPEFYIEESGRKDGGIEKDQKGQDWFKEGLIDTTGAIQYFTISGLRWIDSPGTGALEKAGDTKNMEEMVKEYLPYTDLCIFLTSSSSPGLRSDMKYIKELTDENQEALIVITKSDKPEYDEDENGNEIQIPVPKTAEVRKKQENAVRDQIRESYPEIDENKYNMLSVSTELAKRAIQQDDDEAFKGSNLNLLTAKLIEKCGNRSRKLKEKRVKEQMNHFISDILEGTDNQNGIASIESYIDKISASKKDYLDKLAERKDRIYKDVKRALAQQVRDQVHQWDDEIKKSGKEISDKNASAAINKLVNATIGRRLGEEIGEIIDGFEYDSQLTFQGNFQGGGLSKKSKDIERTYKKKEVVERDPDGLWENIRSFFGKTYYRTRSVDAKVTIHIDLGTNAEDYIDTITAQLESSVRAFIDGFFDDVKENYFKPQEIYVQSVKKELQVLKQRLDAVRFSDMG